MNDNDYMVKLEEIIEEKYGFSEKEKDKIKKLANSPSYLSRCIIFEMCSKKLDEIIMSSEYEELLKHRDVYNSISPLGDKNYFKIEKISSSEEWLFHRTKKNIYKRIIKQKQNERND